MSVNKAEKMIGDYVKSAFQEIKQELEDKNKEVIFVNRNSISSFYS